MELVKNKVDNHANNLAQKFSVYGRYSKCPQENPFQTWKEPIDYLELQESQQFITVLVSTVKCGSHVDFKWSLE